MLKNRMGPFPPVETLQGVEVPGGCPVPTPGAPEQAGAEAPGYQRVRGAGAPWASLPGVQSQQVPGLRAPREVGFMWALHPAAGPGAPRVSVRKARERWWAGGQARSVRLWLTVLPAPVGSSDAALVLEGRCWAGLLTLPGDLAHPVGSGDLAVTPPAAQGDPCCS